jgi:hypothetical protein
MVDEYESGLGDVANAQQPDSHQPLNTYPLVGTTHSHGSSHSINRNNLPMKRGRGRPRKYAMQPYENSIPQYTQDTGGRDYILVNGTKYRKCSGTTNTPDHKQLYDTISAVQYDLARREEILRQKEAILDAREAKLAMQRKDEFSALEAMLGVRGETSNTSSGVRSGEDMNHRPEHVVKFETPLSFYATNTPVNANANANAHVNVHGNNGNANGNGNVILNNITDSCYPQNQSSIEEFDGKETVTTASL